MSWQLLFTLVAASIGVVSGAWLCYPTANANPHALAWAANPPNKSAEGFAQLALAQSAQYWVGGLLLVMAFVVQVAAALAPASEGPVAFLNEVQLLMASACSVLLSLATVGLISVLAYRWRKARLEASLRKASAQLAAHPRLTPLP
jgi:hypothetical protein